MGRSQSTPGLVESRGKVTLEDMWVPPVPLSGLIPSYPRSFGTSSPQQSIRTMPTPDSPAGSTSSERSRQSRHSRHHQHARSGTITLSIIQFPNHIRAHLLVLLPSMQMIELEK